ncbi:MAG TPA: hypothetical protein VKO18_21675 [Terriglobia bacterium]|nr:hypothetical protein [Terriglobia bacterium]
MKARRNAATPTKVSPTHARGLEVKKMLMMRSAPNLLKTNGRKSALDELLKTKGRTDKDVKNEDSSGWLIENKGAKKVLWMSL